MRVLKLVGLILTCAMLLGCATTLPKPKTPGAFANLGEALQFISSCLEQDDFERFVSRQPIAPKDRHPGNRAAFDGLKEYHSKEKPFHSRYPGVGFPTDRHWLKLGGHSKELGHIHIDFVRIKGEWFLSRAWVCR